MAPKTKARAAFAILALTAAFLTVVLLTCLPQKPGGEETASHPPARVAVHPPPAVVEPVPISPAGKAERREERGRVAIIIDDAGYSLKDLQPFLDCPEPLAIAVLPNLPFSEESAKRVTAAGKTLLLHCPMEPLNGENPGPGALRTDHTDAELAALLNTALETVPGAVGVNNHMGSKATADERLMSVLFSTLRQKGLFFVDSRTTTDTVAEQAAEKYGVPFAGRDVFIDNVRTEEEISRSIAAGISYAGTRGSAVLIGHVHTPQILDIVRKNGQALEEADVRLVGLPEIINNGKGLGE